MQYYFTVDNRQHPSRACEHPFDALEYAPTGGDVVHRLGVGREKSVYAARLLQDFARWCALQVIDLWRPPDVLRRYLETGDKLLREKAWEVARTEGVKDAIHAAGLSVKLAMVLENPGCGVVTCASEAAFARGVAQLAKTAAIAAERAAGRGRGSLARVRQSQRDKFQKMVNKIFED